MHFYIHVISMQLLARLVKDLDWRQTLNVLCVMLFTISAAEDTGLTTVNDPLKFYVSLLGVVCGACQCSTSYFVKRNESQDTARCGDVQWLQNSVKRL